MCRGLYCYCEAAEIKSLRTAQQWMHLVIQIFYHLISSFIANYNYHVVKFTNKMGAWLKENYCHAPMAFCGWCSEHYKDHFEEGKIARMSIAG